MNDGPEVTVVIPTHDRWPLLEQALTSALEQQGVELEVIVVDDASSDETPARLAALADRRVRVLRNDTAGGPARARNAALAAARGAWIAFLDDDDVWAPDKLRRQIEAGQRSGATYVYTSAAIFDAEGGVRQIVPAPDPSTAANDILGRNLVPGGCSNLIARADALRETGGFDERLRTLADWDLWIRLMQTGSGAACREVLVGYRRHPGSMVTRGESNAIAELALLAAKHRKRARRPGMRTSYGATYRYFARAHRREGRALRAAELYARAAVEDRRPGDLLRALLALLGPRAADVAERLRGRRPPPRPEPPAWLARHL